jgi:hypothetical protein
MREMNQSWTKRVRTACWVVVALGMLNFVVFVAIATYLGGDAVNGKVEGGHYYLYGVRTDLGRKVYTEVDESVFNYSKRHVYSIFVTWPLVMASAFALNRIRKRSEGN